MTLMNTLKDILRLNKHKADAEEADIAIKKLERETVAMKRSLDLLGTRQAIITRQTHARRTPH